MTSTAVKTVAVIILALTFEGLLFGAEIAERTFPTFEQPTSGGFFGALDAGLAVLQAIFGGIVFLVSLILFSIPGVPWFIQVPVAGIQGTALVWAIVAVIRGGGGDT